MIILFYLLTYTVCVCKEHLSDMYLVSIYLLFCFNATFGNISAISWRPALVVEEAGVPGKNHRP